MSKPAARIRFEAAVHRPVTPADADWAFLRLPQSASEQLQIRSMVSVAGTLAGEAFQTTLEPDGDGGHWLKLEPDVLATAAVTMGQAVVLDIAPVAQEPESKVPDDLRQALNASAKAKAT